VGGVTDRDIDLPPPSDDRSNLNKRVSDDVQRRFGKFVDEHLPNRRGAYGYAVEKAMEEFMDTDRYARIEDDLERVKDVSHQTNALVRQLITAEKEKGAFLEPTAPAGNQAGDRAQREAAVVAELAERIADRELEPKFSESEFNAVITEAAGVGSEPSKRDYRESLIDRDLVDSTWGKYELTDAAFRMSGYEVLEGESP
jgi:hypothetical protein